MADEANNQTAAADDSKAKTVIDDMDNRRLFDSTDEAAAYIEKAQADYADFGSYPVAAVGFTEEGEFDPEVYTDAMRVAVAVLTQRGEGAGSSTVKAIVIYPSPKLEAILSTETGKDWLAGIMEKELNHVAVRQLRKAEGDDEIADAIQTMPTTVEAYTTSGRESTGGILETYNSLWQVIKKGIGERARAFRLANLSKKELRKAMESASYASAVYPTLEDRTNKKGEPESYFEVAANFGLMLARKESLDTTIFERMLSTRNEKEIAVGDDDDSEDFDLEAMAQAVAPAAADSADENEAPAATDETPANAPNEDAAS